jgi:antitoxin VapB
MSAKGSHPVNEHKPPNQRTASLFRNGRNQAVRIPVEFELPGSEVLISRDGDRLIIEPKDKKKRTLLEFLETMEPIPDFPDMDDSALPPLRDVDLE